MCRPGRAGRQRDWLAAPVVPGLRASQGKERPAPVADCRFPGARQAGRSVLPVGTRAYRRLLVTALTHGRLNPVRSYLSEGLAGPCSPPPSSLGFSKCNHGAHSKRGSSLCLLVSSRMAHRTLHGRVGSGGENRVRQNNE